MARIRWVEPCCLIEVGTKVLPDLAVAMLAIMQSQSAGTARATAADGYLDGDRPTVQSEAQKHPKQDRGAVQQGPPLYRGAVLFRPLLYRGTV